MSHITYSRTDGDSLLKEAISAACEYLSKDGLDPRQEMDRDRISLSLGTIPNGSAHPMIQPADWSKHPLGIEKYVGSSRASLYKLIWYSTLAYTMKPPRVRVRWLGYGNANMPFVLASYSVNKGAKGFVRYRKDTLDWGIPITDTDRIAQAASSTFGLRKVWFEPVPPPLLGQVIQRAFDEGVTSAGGVSRHIREVVESSGVAPPFLQFEKSEGVVGLRVRLTSFGHHAVNAWKQFGLIGQAAAATGAVAQVRAGNLSVKEAIASVYQCFEDRFLEGISQQIERDAKDWEGTGSPTRVSPAAICDRSRIYGA